MKPHTVVKKILASATATLCVLMGAATWSANAQAASDAEIRAFHQMMLELEKKRATAYNLITKYGLKDGRSWTHGSGFVTTFKANERSKLIWRNVLGTTNKDCPDKAKTRWSSSKYHFQTYAPSSFSNYELAVYDRTGNLLGRGRAVKGEAKVTIPIKCSQDVAVQITTFSSSHKGTVLFYDNFFSFEPIPERADHFFYRATVADPVQIDHTIK